MITYNVDGVKMPKIKKRDTSAWIRKVAASHGRKVGEIGYMFVDDEKILEVNNEYLGHDYYTDVITFDYDEDDVINGDIVISLDTVRTNAEQFGKPMMMSFTVSSSTASCTSAALMTKALESVKSWRRTRTRRSPCSKVLRF